MARVKIDMPKSFSFTATIPIRISDINYGGHVGNDTFLSIIHEARVQFISHLGYTELNLAGAGLIMSNVMIDFKNEIFYRDTIKASVAVGNLTRISMDFFYKLEKESINGGMIPVAHARTGMVFYDYPNNKIIPVPEEVKLKLMQA